MEGKPVPSNAMCQCPLYLFDHVLYPISSSSDPRTVVSLLSCRWTLSTLLRDGWAYDQGTPIRRKENGILQLPIVQEVVDAGAPHTRRFAHSEWVVRRRGIQSMLIVLALRGSFLVKKEGGIDWYRSPLETLEALKKTGLLYVLNHVVDWPLFVMKSNIFKKWGDTIKATLQKRKQGLKKVEIKEDSQGPWNFKRRRHHRKNQESKA